MGQWQIRFDKMQIQKYVLNLLKQHAQGLLECIFCISVGFIVFDMTFLPFFTKYGTNGPVYCQMV